MAWAKVGDWVLIDPRADGGGDFVPPHPVKVSRVSSNGVDVDVDTNKYCHYWFHNQYEVIESAVPVVATSITKREILEQAADLITGDRQGDYGDTLKNFTDISRLWSVVLGIDVTPWQAALCMDLLKTARLIKTPTHLDSWLDKAGYTGIGGELAFAENDCE